MKRLLLGLALLTSLCSFAESSNVIGMAGYNFLAVSSMEELTLDNDHIEELKRTRAESICKYLEWDELVSYDSDELSGVESIKVAFVSTENLIWEFNTGWATGRNGKTYNFSLFTDIRCK